ncbi:MAG: signal peptidase I [Deltaproteobacteria bacterium]|nr:signal peptidase I [Deltaproteobacteria bacterium]
MNNAISVGNAADPEIQENHNGWFIGHFINDIQRSTPDVEVKWGIHRAGDTKEKLALNEFAKTMSVLISGKFHLLFRKGSVKKEIPLERPGDYVLWDAGVAHGWHAVEDSTVLTVRWPSLAGDQLIVKQ